MRNQSQYLFFVHLSMKRPGKYTIGIEVDKLTNSIVNTISGDSFSTEIAEAAKIDLKNITKKNGWALSWTTELKLADRRFIN